ncbi:MAG: molecular chaperone DnaK [Candidatus Aminicenantes bacterium]|nr:molecular chaperone DnaK [Candidatus Aminicenantes bacterium]
MNPIIGIDLGTTYSCVAILENGKPRVIPNLDGTNTTPSVVTIMESGDHLVGHLALRQAVTNPENTIYAVKRLMGKKMSSQELQFIAARYPFRLTQSENGDVLIEAHQFRMSPQEISAVILKYIKRSAEAYLETDVLDAIVTVPAHFDDHQRQATKDAAKIAGLNVLRVINEPTAASLAYGLEKQSNSRCAVYDMGGGTLDVTILEINNGVFHVLATNGDTYLGGEDFDHRLVDWMLDEFQRENNISLKSDKLAVQRIKEASEKAKRDLSFAMETEINLPFLFSDSSGSKHLRRLVNREKLEELTNDLVKKSIPFLSQALSDSGLKPEDLDDIILVGGQTRMPLVRRAISEFLNKEPNDSMNPDEAVAVGAAIQSAILNGSASKLLILLDVTPLSLGIETENNTFERIIPRNTTIPVRETKPFTTVEHQQKRVRIHVLQGESDKASDNTSLAMFDMVGLAPDPAGVPQIDVTFGIDADGIVTVKAEDNKTGKEQSIEVKPSSGLSPEEINLIIDKSVKKGLAADEEIKADKTNESET